MALWARAILCFLPSALTNLTLVPVTTDNVSGSVEPSLKEMHCSKQMLLLVIEFCELLARAKINPKLNRATAIDSKIRFFVVLKRLRKETLLTLLNYLNSGFHIRVG